MRIFSARNSATESLQELTSCLTFSKYILIDAPQQNAYPFAGRIALLGVTQSIPPGNFIHFGRHACTVAPLPERSEMPGSMCAGDTAKKQCLAHVKLTTTWDLRGSR